MTYRQTSVLDSLPKPIEGGKYGMELGPGNLSLVLFDGNGGVYAQASVPLQSDVIELTEYQQIDKVNQAAKAAARLINSWGKLAQAVTRELGVPVSLDPKIVIEGAV